jgi:hypothetical protein
MVFKRATFEVGAAVRETGKALERVGECRCPHAQVALPLQISCFLR